VITGTTRLCWFLWLLSYAPLCCTSRRLRRQTRLERSVGDLATVEDDDTSRAVACANTLASHPYSRHRPLLTSLPASHLRNKKTQHSCRGVPNHGGICATMLRNDFLVPPSFKRAFRCELAVHKREQFSNAEVVMGVHGCLARVLPVLGLRAPEGRPTTTPAAFAALNVFQKDPLMSCPCLSSSLNKPGPCLPPPRAIALCA